MKSYFLLASAIILFPFSNLFSQSWSTIGLGVENYTADYTCVYTMLEFNNELYIGGCFTSVNGVPANYVAKFDGTNWSAIGNGLWHTANTGIVYSGVRSLAVFNGELYAGGIFNRSGTTPVFNVVKWNGNDWVAVGGFNSGLDGVLSLCVFNNELYAGGNLWGGYNSIAKWNGASWINLGTGIQDSIGNRGLVRAMEVYNGRLYIGGQFVTGNGIASENLITWDGTTFIPVGSGANGNYGVTRLGNIQNDLIVTGGFVDINGSLFNNIAGYDSVSWSTYGTGIGFPGGNSYEAQAIEEYDNKMIVGGSFIIAGSTSVNSIAEWDGNTWQGLGSGVNGFIASLISYNGDLYAAGNFSSAGGIAVNNIAKWKSSSTGIIYTDPTKNEISVFPNPASDLLNIEVPEKMGDVQKIFLLNSIGNTIFSIEPVNDDFIQLDLHSYSSSVYFIKIKSSEGLFIKKIVKL